MPKTTKENILIVALHLFARDGYEAVYVSQIAGELGMTKGALYRHYESKRDIFEHIVKRMEQRGMANRQANGCLSYRDLDIWREHLFLHIMPKSVILPSQHREAETVGGLPSLGRTKNPP